MVAIKAMAYFMLLPLHFLSVTEEKLQNLSFQDKIETWDPYYPLLQEVR
jgi:hypothetical protein